MSTIAPFRVEDTYTKPSVVLLTASELKEHSLRDLYHDSCRRYNVKSNAFVATLLPDAAGGAHTHVSELNLSSTILGKTGAIALLPILHACTRLEHLDLSGCGLVTSVADALIDVLWSLTRLRTLKLDHNDLGTPVAERVLEIVRAKKTLRYVSVEHCMFIAPLKRKIEAAAELNAQLPRGSTPPPPRDDDSDAEEKEETGQKALEPARPATVTPAPPPEPVWVPLTLQDVKDVFSRHSSHMRDIFGLFVETDLPGHTTEAEFERVMRVLRIPTLSPPICKPEQQRVVVICKKLGVYDAAHRTVNYLGFIDAVRVHVHVSGRGDGPQQPDDAGVQCALDAMHDMKAVLVDAFEMLDIDRTGAITWDEFYVGVRSMRQLVLRSDEDVHGALEWVGAGRAGANAHVKFRDALGCLQI